jgi:hypothetical protein
MSKLHVYFTADKSQVVTNSDQDCAKEEIIESTESGTKIFYVELDVQLPDGEDGGSVYAPTVSSTDVDVTDVTEEIRIERWRFASRQRPTNHTKPWDQGEANARLISSAPELLEALKACLCELDLLGEMFPSETHRKEARHKARAAIAKAEGGAA